MPEIILRVDGADVSISVAPDGDGYAVRVGRRESRLRVTPLEPGVALLEASGRAHLVHTTADGGRRYLHVDGVTIAYEIAGGEERRPAETAPAAGDLSAPMPGVVTQVAVREGEAVRLGQPLVIVEAMKMEHVIRSPRAGIVQALRVHPGDQVESGAVVAEIAPPPSREDAAT